MRRWTGAGAAAQPMRRLSMRFRCRELRDEFGGSIVELALLMPVFTLMLIGTTELGLLAYDAIEVSNAAYAGAAYASRNRGTALDSTHILLAAVNDGVNVPGLTATSTTSCTCNGTSSPCTGSASSCAYPNRIVEYVQVNTSATLSSLLHCPGLPPTFVLQGQATMRVVE